MSSLHFDVIKPKPSESPIKLYDSPLSMHAGSFSIASICAGSLT